MKSPVMTKAALEAAYTGLNDAVSDQDPKTTPLPFVDDMNEVADFVESQSARVLKAVSENDRPTTKEELAELIGHVAQLGIFGALTIGFKAGVDQTLAMKGED